MDLVQLKGILALIFSLISLLFFVDCDRSGGPLRYLALIAAFLLAALSKGAGLTLPIVFLCLPVAVGRIDRRELIRVLPFFVIGLAMSILEIRSQHAIGSALIRSDGFAGRLAVAGCAVWFYLWKFIWPFNLIPVYPRWTIDAGRVVSYLPAILLLVAVALAWCWRKGPGKYRLRH